jgi:hypothetical protein
LQVVLARTLNLDGCSHAIEGWAANAPYSVVRELFSTG